MKKLIFITLFLFAGLFVSAQWDVKNQIFRQIANGDTIYSRIYPTYDFENGSNPYKLFTYDSIGVSGALKTNTLSPYSGRTTTVTDNLTIGNNTNDTARFVGNVGINNTKPTDWLHIRTGQTIDRGITITDFSDATTDHATFTFKRSLSNTFGTFTRTTAGTILGAIDVYSVSSANTSIYSGGLSFIQQAVNASATTMDMIYYASRTSGTTPSARIRFSTGGQIFMIGNTANSGTLQSSSNFSISFNQQTAQSIGIERSSSGNGSVFTTNAGGGQTGGVDRSAGMYIIGPNSLGQMTTGTGITSVRLARSDRTASSGTSDNATSDALIITSANNLSDNVAKGLFEVAVGTDGYASGIIHFGIGATDGDSTQTYTGQVFYTCQDVNGTILTTYSETPALRGNNPVGMIPIATTWSAVVGAGKVTLTVVSNLAITGSTSHKIFYTITNNSLSAITQL